MNGLNENVSVFSLLKSMHAKANEASGLNAKGNITPYFCNAPITCIAFNASDVIFSQCNRKQLPTSLGKHAWTCPTGNYYFATKKIAKIMEWERGSFERSNRKVDTFCLFFSYLYSYLFTQIVKLVFSCFDLFCFSCYFWGVSVLRVLVSDDLQGNLPATTNLINPTKDFTNTDI